MAMFFDGLLSEETMINAEAKLQSVTCNCVRCLDSKRFSEVSEEVFPGGAEAERLAFQEEIDAAAKEAENFERSLKLSHQVKALESCPETQCKEVYSEVAGILSTDNIPLIYLFASIDESQKKFAQLQKIFNAETDVTKINAIEADIKKELDVLSNGHIQYQSLVAKARRGEIRATVMNESNSVENLLKAERNALKRKNRLVIAAAIVIGAVLAAGIVAALIFATPLGVAAAAIAVKALVWVGVAAAAATAASTGTAIGVLIGGAALLGAGIGLLVKKVCSKLFGQSKSTRAPGRRVPTKSVASAGGSVGSVSPGGLEAGLRNTTDIESALGHPSERKEGATAIRDVDASAGTGAGISFGFGGSGQGSAAVAATSSESDTTSKKAGPSPSPSSD